MKYSALMPIRSISIVHASSSGKSGGNHNRILSETPMLSSMGVQCDSLESLTSERSQNPKKYENIKLKQKVALDRTSKRNPYFLDEKGAQHGLNMATNNDSQGTIKELKVSKKIEFAKVGNWDSSYILKITNTNLPRVKQAFSLSRNKIINRHDLSQIYIKEAKRKLSKIELNLPWTYQCIDESIFNVSGLLRNRKKSQTNY